ncbi:hypothetical protein RUND412_006579 [Rhizina undulata]
MATSHNTPKIIPLWLFFSSLVVVWDAFYCLLRPRSMPGGDLHDLLWKPYALYSEIDYVYGFKFLEEKNGFTSAQGVMNLLEVLLNFIYVWGWWKGSSSGWVPMTGFMSVVMTESKTILYLLNEFFSEWTNVGHNDMRTLTFMYFLPNSLWIVFPAFCIYHFWGEINARIDRGQGVLEHKKTL